MLVCIRELIPQEFPSGGNRAQGHFVRNRTSRRRNGECRGIEDRAFGLDPVGRRAFP